MAREQFLKIIESEKTIKGRFCNPRRIDSNGGNGQFSLLFKAFDPVTRRNVALKFYDPTKQHLTERVQRFQREAEILKILESEPYVINCLDGLCVFYRDMVDSKSGIKIPLPLQFIPMDLAQSSVENLIYAKTPDALDLILCFKEMIKALFRVHKRLICHRDLKPSNFLIVGKQICLSDFGTAKSMNATQLNIRDSYERPIGDRRYIAPEIFFSFGIADDIVFHSDLFSMGAILFEMFTQTRLTSQIYTAENFRKIDRTKQVLSVLHLKDRKEVYRSVANDLGKSIAFPDIYSYNDFVPKCIKKHLNDLYKSLAAIDFQKRIINPMAIHRKLDICILTLRNERKYQIWLERKRLRRLAREKIENQ